MKLSEDLLYTPVAHSTPPAEAAAAPHPQPAATELSTASQRAHAMSHDILVNVTPQETRVAMLAPGVVQELHIERASARGLVGNI